MASLNFDEWPSAFENILIIEFSGLFNPGDSHDKLSFVPRALVLDQPVNLSFVRDVLTLRQFISLCTVRSPRGDGVGLVDVDEKYSIPESCRETERPSGSRSVPHETILLQHRWMLEDLDESLGLSKQRWKGTSDSESNGSCPPTHRSFPILSYRRASHLCSYLQDSNRTTYPIIARPRDNKTRAEIGSPLARGAKGDDEAGSRIQSV